MRQRCREARKQLHSVVCDLEANILCGVIAAFLNQNGSLFILIE